MRFRFRRRFSLGPFHFNLCRRGLGGSLGRRGVRIGITNRGNLYISVGIPGTGINFYHEFGGGKRRGKGSSDSG
ncbi:MAG: hypothetical protein KatS3mg023_3612 [Armatimonadota bacterium]|nr:MAG: hypothetical protein KatS3mg023_3612 [Armatimonadota bacterium]